MNSAIAFTSSVEVLVARIAPGFMTRSSAVNTSRLTGSDSNTASIATSAAASAPYSSVGRSSPSRRSRSAGVRRPFWTWAS